MVFPAQHLVVAFGVRVVVPVIFVVDIVFLVVKGFFIILVVIIDNLVFVIILVIVGRCGYLVFFILFVVLEVLIFIIFVVDLRFLVVILGRSIKLLIVIEHGHLQRLMQGRMQQTQRTRKRSAYDTAIWCTATGAMASGVFLQRCISEDHAFHACTDTKISTCKMG